MDGPPQEGRPWSLRSARRLNHALTRKRGPCRPWRGGGGYEIRTREGLPPTRFPSVRPRPLGESSAGQSTGPRDPLLTPAQRR